VIREKVLIRGDKIKGEILAAKMKNYEKLYFYLAKFI